MRLDGLRERIGSVSCSGLFDFFAIHNPEPWKEFADPARTAMSFFNVFKYPPSPDFVSITIGLSLLMFIAVAYLRGLIARILGDFGRTPSFTNVAHLYITHGLMLLPAIAIGRPEAALNLFTQVFADKAPQKLGVVPSNCLWRLAARARYSGPFVAVVC